MLYKILRPLGGKPCRGGVSPPVFYRIFAGGETPPLQINGEDRVITTDKKALMTNEHVECHKCLFNIVVIN